ncbi:SRPBCC family protein [Silicimonas algicola]|uniref:Putative membrane protein n=2 Tax=Silicimonas algicola TaxID=1826607 RepID=A0A316FVH3_9RHOB|nr:SRPBCC family protein [Silicimonas algicola]PWK52731.1 putative membrane protein [Silicimonas algicola]
MNRLTPNRRQLARGIADNRTYLLVSLAALTGAGALALALNQSRQANDQHPPDDAPGRTGRRSRFGRFAVSGRTVTINRPRQDVYDAWRDMSRLPHFMENVESVTVQGDLTRWTIRGPADFDVELETRIVSDRPGEEIAWRSTENSAVETSGKVMFRDAPAGRGTEVEAVIAYVPPAGRIGQMIAKLFQAEPSIQGRRDLKRLKMLLETGEIATSRNRKTTA